MFAPQGRADAVSLPCYLSCPWWLFCAEAIHLRKPSRREATMREFTPEGLQKIEELAHRHGVSRDAVLTIYNAITDGYGTQAQFSHPDLGGMGQWSQGGMIMIGDMFNQRLKYRVDALCNELAGILRSQPLVNTE